MAWAMKDVRDPPETSVAPRYDASFEVDLPEELFAAPDAGAAVRVTLGLAVHLRVQAMRAVNFVGAATLTRDASMRAAAMVALDRARRGYELAAGVLLDHDRRDDLDPTALRLLRETCGDGRLDRQIVRDMGLRLEQAAIRVSGGGFGPDDYDALLLTLYDPFHPEMKALGARMSAAAVQVRDRMRAAARKAEDRANDSRMRIEEIARTVRLISLNARVEAARAGEEGRAFGVIAQEIKALAEQTEAASVEMGQSVAEIMEAFGGGKAVARPSD